MWMDVTRYDSLVPSLVITLSPTVDVVHHFLDAAVGPAVGFSHSRLFQKVFCTTACFRVFVVSTLVSVCSHFVIVT